MFIEKIWLRNLASIRGTWTLDFTNPDYKNGIFAITGSNGAGKSTIMDAICLALYGKTPRLDTFNSQNDEIMSKGTRDCASEVTFRTEEGRFVVRWSHKRTQKNAKSETKKNIKAAFSEVTREFFEIPENARNRNDFHLLSSKKTEVGNLVEQHTGLTFPQFMQTAMLAQFQFEKFLKCVPKDRTEILETLTNTGVFRKLVDLAKIRAEISDTEIKTLTDQMSGIKILTQEEAAAFEAETAQLKTEKESVKKEVGALTVELELLKRWNELQIRIQEQKSTETQLQADEEAFAPDLQRLQRGQKARFVRKSASDFRAKQQFLEECRSKIEKLTLCIADLTKQQQEAENLLTQCVSAKEKAAKDLETEAPKILKARTLDTQIEAEDGQISQQKKEISDSETRQKTAEEKIKSAQKELETIQRKLLVLRGTLSPKMNEDFDPFQKEYSGIKTRIEEQLRRCEKWEQFSKDISDGNQKLAEFQKLFEDIQTVANLKEAAAIDASKELESVGKDFDAQLERRFQAEKNAKNDENVKIHLKNLEKILENVQKTHSDLQNLQKKKAENQKKLAQVSVDCSNAELSIKNLETEIQNLNEAQQKVRFLKNYEEERRHLQEGSRCPLCGSTEHPYIIHNPLEETNESELESERNTKIEEKKTFEAVLKSKQQAESQLRVELAADERSESERADDEQRFAAQLAEEYVFFELKTQLPPDVLKEFIDRKRLELADAEEKRTELLQEFKSVQESKICCEKRKKSLDDENRTAQENFQTQKSRLNTFQLQISEKEKQRDALSAEMFAESTRLEGSIQLFVPEFTLDSSSEAGSWTHVLAELKNLYDLQCEILNKKNEEEKKSTEIEKSTLELNSIQNSINEKRTSLSLKESQRRMLAEERFQVFERRSPNEEERRLKLAEQNAQKALDSANSAFQKIQSDLKHQSDEHRKTQTDENEALAELKTLEDEFTQLLLQQGFTDSADFDASNLSEEVLQTLEKTAGGLQARKSALEGIAHQNKRDLESFRRPSELSTEFNSNSESESEIQAPSERSAEELTTLLDEKRTSIETLTSEITEKELKQKEQAETEAKFSTLQQKKAELEAQSKRWKSLFQTLGGTRNSRSESFVNYVQYITLKRLLHCANEQLKLLNPRYLLKVDDEDPTKIEICDKAQADATRSVETISGGETFLVSMALALGLTQMASRKVEIDSFFIDEGFGSLAADKLKNALDVLKTYNQNSGKQKLIGIISHVSSIHEEIPTVISVKPYPPSNFSKIEGAGVYENSEDASR